MKTLFAILFTSISLFMIGDCHGQENPGKAKKLERKAMQDLRDSSLNGATEKLKKAIRYDSSKLSLYMSLHEVYKRKKEYQASIEILDAYQKRQNRKDLRLMTVKAETQYCTGQKQEGIRTLQSALDIVNNRIEDEATWEDLSMKLKLLMFLGKRDEAEQFVSEHKEDHPRLKQFQKRYLGRDEKIGTSPEKGIGRKCDVGNYGK